MEKKLYLVKRNHNRKNIRNSLKESTFLLKCLSESKVGDELIILRVNVSLRAKRRLFGSIKN